jgi:hypothetical protein
MLNLVESRLSLNSSSLVGRVKTIFMWVNLKLELDKKKLRLKN